ncbi:hypothetical protein PYW07_001184 [Mythimna separata]|uniref:Uncharacterized protein n=1 Tax=Mythimna separata TaxID=271217 RepID=A0AAD7YUQ4_MYTSE|nr:hypothetical protein PYW07_001184 [Mythimna separata]
MFQQAPTFLNMVFKESSYFFIKPCGAQLLSRLAPGISVTFAITFTPVQYEDYTHRVTFYTDVDQYVLPMIGENFRIVMTGSTHTVSVELEKQIVRFFDTYNTMMRQQTYKVINRSDHVLTYMCMKNQHVYDDFNEKVKLATIFYNMKNSESAKFMKLVHYDVLSSAEHERVYTRIFYDEIQGLVADETLHYRDSHFSIEPIKGTLWPNKTTELTITFRPQEIGEFSSTAFLDIDGLEERVPLQLLGASLPPAICLNVETLDMDRVYINKPYHYEIVAINKGHINGVIVYKDVPPLFGSILSCTPAMHCLKPGDKEIFVISFCNSNQGPYFEEVNFSIRDTDVVLKLYLKGEVIYPSLMFSIPCLDFGKISLGVPKTMELDVINESVVYVSGSLKISSDGPEISSITLVDYAVADSPKPKIPQWPREFNIEPWKVDIGPESRISIRVIKHIDELPNIEKELLSIFQVTLTANLVRANQTSLELELEKSDSPPIVVPVMYNAMVPAISPAPDIKQRACFIDFSYFTEIVIRANEFQGYFTLEQPSENSTLEVNVAIKEGFIEPNSKICLPVSIRTSVTGLQEYFVRINLFGLSKPIDICHITSNGVRPIVTCTPMALHWGQSKLLMKSEKTLTLFNDSPVSVKFSAALLSKDGRWEISPSEGYVEPESEKDLTLSLYLIDASTYTNKVVLHLEKVKDILVPLSATGFGTSIVVGELRDQIVLGRHFTKIPVEAKVIVENCGTRLHALEMSEYYKPPKTKQGSAGFFDLQPRSFKIGAGEKVELTVTGCSHKVMTYTETWYLIGSVEGINKKELLMECPIIAEFVDPKIEVSSSVVELQYDYGPYSEYYKLTGSGMRDISSNEVFEKNSISSVERLIALMTKDNESMKYEMLKKVTPMIDGDYNIDFEWIEKFAKLEKYSKPANKIDINDVVQLVLHRGMLQPGEVQDVHVIFRPKYNIAVRAVLECEVLGGPSESIVVTGQSCDLRYEISAESINFKIRSFHEQAIEKLKITNTALLNFEYKTYLNEPVFDNELHGTILELLPPEKTLEPDQEAEMKIVMRPGVVGYFHRVFLLEIGHLPHIPIEVFGWGEIPQIYITLLKPAAKKMNPELGYMAIPALTLEYLACISEIFSKGKEEHLNSPFTDKCFEDPDFQEGWHICTSWDEFPSVMDIDMAIERLMVIEHIKARPEILTAYSSPAKVGPIPGFLTVPYVIDFGVVITGSTVQCTAEIINYGPIAAKVHFAKGTNVPLWLGMKLCGKLNPGEVGKLEVTFMPTSVDFTELEQHVETNFHIEVPYGVTIPIEVKALCAVPYLVSNVSAIDFGSVRGKPTCIWYVSLKLKTSGPVPMVVMDSSGKYEPEEGGWLSVAFKPTTEMLYEGVLIFKFHMNPNKMMIPVMGQGIIPHVHIIGPNVNFPPTLPWAETTDIYFGLTNPCPFPIELIIAHTDEKWKEEEDIFNLLYKYYNKPEEMLVPAIKPGVGLPTEVVNFFHKFQAQVRKTKEEELALTKAIAKNAAASAKKAKSPKTAGKSDRGQTKPQSPALPTQVQNRTEAEIIADEMKKMKEIGVDPLKESLNQFYKSVELPSDKPSKGILIFFHGSPCEEMHCQEMAYSVAKQLKLPTVNVDHSIVEALCVTKILPRDLIVTAVTENYEQLKKKLETDTPAEHDEDEFNEDKDEFEILWKKIQFLAMTRSVATPRSRASDKKKKKSPISSVGSNTALDAMGSSTLFQMDLVEQLLTELFLLPKYHRGFVVDSLSSIIVRNAPLVLSVIIKCKRSIRNLHLVLCQSDITKWVQAHEEAQREADMLQMETQSKVYDESEIDEILKSFEDMDADEFEKAAPDLKSIYVSHGLEERRLKYLEKFAAPALAQSAKKEKSGREMRSTSIAEAGESKDAKKKIKRDETRGKQSSEFAAVNAKYIEYNKNVYENLINMANNWIIDECDVGNPLYTFTGQIAGAAQKKNKKKSELHLQMSEVDFENRGFPLTLIMCPCLRYKEGLKYMFSQSPLVRGALKEEEEFDVLKSPINRQEFTVLLPKIFPTMHHEPPLQWWYLDEKPIKKCECNILTDLHLLDDSNQDNVMNILSKWHCTCGKKVTSSQTSTGDIPSVSVEMNNDYSEDETEAPMPLRTVRPVHTTLTRIVLEPGELVRCKYSFSPQDEGNYSVKRFIEVSGWPDSRADINVNGICDLPRLDSRPKKMFENFVRRTHEENVYKLTYLDDLKVFEFGPIFVGNNRIYEEKYTIDLKNSSLVTADVVIEFLEDTDVFEYNKTFISLKPGCRDKLTISAAPAVVGVHSSVLLFCVKDNPEIVTVNITCNGVLPIVEILPLTKAIEYGKLLLYRRADDRFIVKNDSILPIMWKIRNPQDFVEDFIIAHTSGIVARHDNQVVPVTYIACQVGVISVKVLIIDIYDAEGRGDPMLVENLSFSAECYDVMVECAYENPLENFLNYGNVKVNSTVVRELYLVNRGKYSIFFRFKKVKNFPEPSLLRSFECLPESGVIPASLRLTVIEFECTPTTSMNLVNVPAFTCSLLDGSKNQVVVAKFPVCISIASFYNTFTLFPLGELNFHIIAVGTGITRDVILNNTSKCPVTYEIVLPPAYQVIRDPTLPPPATKEKSTKIRNPPLKCGNFLIMNEDNLLPPGTSRIIPIQFCATGARKFEETINFIISDTCPAEANGVPLKLVGTGAMPTLDLWNIDTTFREHLIVKNLSEYKVPESSPHCVFTENSVTLHFFSVTIHSSHTGYIDLYNCGLVSCALTMKLHHQTNSNSNIFSLDKFETHIEPLLHKNLGIIFSPAALEEYRAVLEIRLKLLDNQEQSFKICLIGEGVIPRIELVSPPLRHERVALLTFPVTCLGSISNKAITFKNIATVISVVILEITNVKDEGSYRPVFWLSPVSEESHVVQDDHKVDLRMKVILKPKETITLYVYYNPITKGRTMCEVHLTITNNPYEYFAIVCEGESFMEDVILTGLEMLPMDMDLDTYKASTEGTVSTSSSADRKSKSKANIEKKGKPPPRKKEHYRLSSSTVRDQNEASTTESSLLKYVLDFGGCELCALQRRSVIMVNNSEKVYKFTWTQPDCLVVKPSIGYISPAEEKDIEIIFFCAQPVVIRKELLSVALVAISDDTLTLDVKGTTWDNRQIVTLFDHNAELSINERCETLLDEQTIPPSTESFLGKINMVIVYSAQTEYTKFVSTLKEKKELLDTFIYQTREFKFTVENSGRVPMKISWSFQIDDEFPARIDKNEFMNCQMLSEDNMAMDPHNTCTGTTTNGNELPAEKDPSNVTLFSNSQGRSSVDTWFEVDLPFSIEPVKDCLKPGESRVFKVTFAPQDAFDYRVRLKSTIDNLDPYDQNLSCMIIVRSVIPYFHLDFEESDYLTSGRRKIVGLTLPPRTSVLEFNVLGSGCYKKTFNVINPTSEPYEFIFEMFLSDNSGLIPFHCNKLKGYVEGGTSREVTFTFTPTAPGDYESHWKFEIPARNLLTHILVVGLVREPEVIFVPTILIIRNSLVGFTSTNVVILKNNEAEDLEFEFKGNSLCNESGKTPVICVPNEGTLKARSETPINIVYTPIQDGPLSYKIFCSVTYLTKYLTLCVNALSYSIKPKVTYYLIGHEHVLNSEAITNIHLEQTASAYERTIPFTIKNDGSATFFFDWSYNVSRVKKFMQLNVEPKSGHVTPGNTEECTLYFTLKQIPVQAFPVTLSISDGPEYSIFIHAEIEKPLYHFSFAEYDFSRCFTHAPDFTYKKSLVFTNDDRVPIIIDLNFHSIPELFVEYEKLSNLKPSKHLKIAIYFRPKQVKTYEFTLQFWVNSLVEENIIIKGEGIPLLFDLYEGCQKSFDLGHVKVGEKFVRTIEVMNHSKIPIDATYIFREMYPVVEDTTKSDTTSVCLDCPGPQSTSTVGPSRVQMLQTYKNDKIRDQIAMDIQNALSSLKVIPSKCTIKPYGKVPVKIQFKPVGLIKTLNVQLNMKVLNVERPLVNLSGCATGMHLVFSQNSLQFGRVRKRGCKKLKVMLMNKGDFGARFWWQPLISDEFTITPLYGMIAAHTNVTFTITFRPVNHNPFIKVWASCNLENYMPLELALYATCIDMGNIENQTLYMECPVRDEHTDYIILTNPTDDLWLVLSEIPSGPFETWKEFNVEPNSTVDVPVTFKPKRIGRHDSQVLYSPLGETALIVALAGNALGPNPNGNINISVPAKELHTEPLLVYNITESPESYKVSTEVVRMIPDKFDAYFEIKCPDVIKTWGEAAATCRWSFVGYADCEITFRIMFINDRSREYQYYNIRVVVTPSPVVDTLSFECRAREMAQKELIIKNPLAEDAEYYITCEKLECPDVLKINGNSEATLHMTYSPLVVGDTSDYLEVANFLVGSFIYKVILKCLPAKEKTLEYETELGSSIPIRVRVHNKTDEKANFSCTVSHPSILAEEEYVLGAFEKGKFLIRYEPTELGVQNCKISFNSPVAGEFVYNIQGTGTEPTPKGPYEIKAAGYALIPFKNVFDDARMFKIYTDKSEFYVRNSIESIRPKKDIKIQVFLIEKPAAGWKELPTGTLTIETFEPATPKVNWTFFLQGSRLDTP